MKEKRKNYRVRSFVYKSLGNIGVGATTTGAFFAYESIIDWSNFKKDLENFIVVSEQNLKLNLAIAFPILISIIVYLIVFLKKNKSYFKDKISLGLLITILILYLIYSIIEVSMVSLIGAWSGVTMQELVFEPLSKSARRKYDEQHEIDLEEAKERRRIMARKKAEMGDLDGSV